MAWIQGTRDAELLGHYRPTGGPPVPYGAYGNYLVPIGAVHEGTPADGPASSSFGQLGALGSRGAHDLSTGPRILASLNTDAATFAVDDGAAPHRYRPEQVGYHRDATSTLSQTPGAGNPSAEATPSQIQGVLNPGGGLARQAAGVAKAGPVVISSGPESDIAAVVDEAPSAGSAADRKILEGFYRDQRWSERQTPFPKSRPIVLPGGAISCLGRIDINYNSDVSWDSEAAKVAANRFFGAIRAGWAAAGGVGSVMLLVAPEPTGATKVAGAAALGFCVDEMIAGVRAAATGEYYENFKTQAIAAAGQKVIGLTEEESLPIARGIDGVAELGVSLLPRALQILGARAAEKAAETSVTIAAPNNGFAKQAEYLLPADIAEFAGRYESDLNAAVANRMRKLGIPEKSIGLKGTPIDQAFELRSTMGGSNLHPDWSGVRSPAIRVDVAALDAQFNATSPTWATASWKDRIDSVIAHEWTEVFSKAENFGARHNHALQSAADTALPITPRARQILLEDRLFRPRAGN